MPDKIPDKIHRYGETRNREEYRTRENSEIERTDSLVYLAGFCRRASYRTMPAVMARFRLRMLGLGMGRV